MLITPFVVFNGRRKRAGINSSPSTSLYRDRHFAMLHSGFYSSPPIKAGMKRSEMTVKSVKIVNLSTDWDQLAFRPVTSLRSVPRFHSLRCLNVISCPAWLPRRDRGGKFLFHPVRQRRPSLRSDRISFDAAQDSQRKRPNAPPNLSDRRPI